MSERDYFPRFSYELVAQPTSFCMCVASQQLRALFPQMLHLQSISWLAVVAAATAAAVASAPFALALSLERERNSNVVCVCVCAANERATPSILNTQFSPVQTSKQSYMLAQITLVPIGNDDDDRGDSFAAGRPTSTQSSNGKPGDPLKGCQVDTMQRSEFHRWMILIMVNPQMR